MIKIGTSLILEVTEKDITERYKCKVIEQTGSFLFVDYPISEISGRTGFFIEETEFLASFVGEDNSVYQFKTVLDSKKKLNIPSLILKYPGDKELKRIQRREYVRIETTNDIAIHDPLQNIMAFTSVTYDLSGGGLTFYLPDQLSIPLDTELEIWLVLVMEAGTYEYVRANAKVIRITEGKNSRNNTISIKYTKIENRARQTIIRYCINRQLITRRKKLS